MFIAGVDIGGTSIKFGVLDDNFDFVHSEMFPPVPGDPYATVERIVRAMRESPVPIMRIGVGTAGQVETDEQLVTAINLGWKRAPIKRMLRDITGIRTWVDNDAQAALAAEWKNGVLQDCSTGILLTLGTGVGGALLLEGKPWRGLQNNASELGHLVTHVGGRPCPCGSRGCFEQYASASALSRLGGGKTAKEILDLAKAGDEQMLVVFEEYLVELGAGITSLFWVFQPQKLALGGGVSRAGTFLLDNVKRVLRDVYGQKDVDRVCLARHENEAGMMGAAALAAYHLG